MNSVIRLLGISTIIILQTLAQDESEGPTIRIHEGLIEGFQITSARNKEIYAFLGIPYAKPPVGELRFKAALPPDPWDETYEAMEEGNNCLQFFPNYGMKGNEDCLYLNVFTNKIPKNSEELKAVMVWIHGGAFILGSGSAVIYGPDHILTEDVLLVTINYRLGLLGFLSLSEVGVPGNNGLKDQVMALRWVQKNIAKFGGDPNRVTIFGESAGGASVHYHLLSPMSKGLFHRAISQSGSVLNPWAYAEPEYLQDLAFRMGTRINCSTTDPAVLLRCFQDASPRKIAELHAFKANDPADALLHRPTRENGSVSKEDMFLPTKPEELILAGSMNEVPYITGINSRETILLSKYKDFTSYALNYTLFRGILTDVLRIRFPGVEARRIMEEAWIYYNGNEKNEENMMENFIDLSSDLMFVCGTDMTVKMQSERSSQPVFYYYFSFEGNLGLSKFVSKTLNKGTSHTDELGYLFQTMMSPPVDENSDEMKTLRRMVKMWTNFAKTGNPSSEVDAILNVKWEANTKTDHVYLTIDKDLSMQRDLLKERMKFWEDKLWSS